MVQPVRLASRLLICSVCAAPALAVQSPPDYTVVGNTVQVAGGAPAPITKLIEGDVTGDQIPDLVALCNGTPYLLNAPALRRWPATVPVTTTINDMAILAASASDSRVRIAVVGSDGVYLCAYSQDPAQAAQPWSSVKIPQTSWYGAPRIECADLDQDGDPDLYGVSAADARHLLVLLNDGAGGWVPQADVVLPQPILRVVAANLDGTGALEIGCLTTTGMNVRALDGTPVVFLRSTDSGDSATVLRRPGLPDRIAWLTKSTDHQSEVLYIVGYGVWQGWMSTGLTSCAGVASADWDADGDPDLLVATTNPGSVTILENQSAGEPVFSSASTHIVVIDPLGAGSGAVAHCAPVWRDLDNGGKPCIAVACESHARVQVYPAEPILNADGSPRFSSDGGHPCFHSAEYPEGTATNGPLTMNVKEAWSTNPAFNYLEVLVWKRAYASATVSGVAVGHFLFSLASIHADVGSEFAYAPEVPLNTSWNNQNPSQSPPEAPMPWDDSGEPNYRYYLEVRKVHYDSVTHQITAALRTFAAGVAGSRHPGPADTYQMLLQEPGAWLGEIYFNGVGLSGPKIGGFVPLSSIPDFDYYPVIPQPVIFDY